MSLLTVRPDDPSELSYPATLPIEVALQVAPIERILDAYGLDAAAWDILRQNSRFVADVKAAEESLQKEGMSFKMKARLQAEELLKTSWRMIHAPLDQVPPSVKADLLKFTIRCAGLDNDPKSNSANNSQANNLQININLG